MIRWIVICGCVVGCTRGNLAVPVPPGGGVSPDVTDPFVDCLDVDSDGTLVFTDEQTERAVNLTNRCGVITVELVLDDPAAVFFVDGSAVFDLADQATVDVPIRFLADSAGHYEGQLSIDVRLDADRSPVTTLQLVGTLP